MSAAALPSGDAVRSFDLRALPAGFYDDPFPWYHALREQRPVHRCPDGSWLLTRYADCAAVYRDPRFSSDKQRMFRPAFGSGPLYRHHTTSLVFNDPPYHTRVRELLADALKPSAVRAMRPVLEALVSRLLDEAEPDDEGRVDLIGQYAAAIPLEVIGNFLTVPHEERGPLRDWSLKILGALEVDLSPETKAAGEAAVEDFSDYLRSLIARRRREGRGDATDILSALIGSHDRGDLTEDELLQNCIFLLNAGHETTTNLIGNGVHVLLENPDELRLLRESPELIRPAVEEMLRYQSPNQLGNREALETTEIGGAELPAGAQITLCIGAANRDPERFPEPDRFDVRRQPNPHLAFATGIHSCLGMSLARLEGQIAIATLLRRYPGLTLAGEPVRQRRARFRALSSLPVRLARGRRPRRS